MSVSEVSESRRRYNRVPFVGHCELRQLNGEEGCVACRMIDLGAGGLALISHEPVATLKTVAIRFGGADSDVEEYGRVVYCQLQQTGEYVVGVHFDRDVVGGS